MPTKEQTINDHRERLNRVLVYIQEHIEKPLLLKSLAAIAHFSPFHFHRIFTAHVGETLSDYVRRVRLDKAAGRLYYSDPPIIGEHEEEYLRGPGPFFKEDPKNYYTIIRCRVKKKPS